MTDARNPEEADPYLDKVDEILALRDKDPVGTFEALKALAPRSVVAEVELGLAYGRGLGTPVDEAAEEKCYQRAAEKGSPTALFNLGVCSRAREDYPKALDYYRRAAALGGSEAMEAWEELKEWVDLRDARALIETDAVGAYEAYRILAEGGSVQAMLRLAQAYGLGAGTEKDPIQSEHWYRRALEAGSGKDKGRAAYQLGGIATARGDYAKAREMYQTGIDSGSGQCVYAMGVLYARGLGVEKDQCTARAYYEQGARLGNLYALRNLARQDLSGRFGPVNFLRGVPRFVRAMKGLSCATSKWGGRWIWSSETGAPLIGPK